MAHALSDQQVAKELDKMVSFIKQEALEKAREIEIKADEEHSIEKMKLVRAETAEIDAAYERKFKQAELSQQIARSTVTNKIRLKVLGHRQELLDGIFEEARERLKGVSERDGYKKLLKELILEGLYDIVEKRVEVQGREKDFGILRDAVNEAKEEYVEHTGLELDISLDESNPLPDELAGGVIISGLNGKIVVNNTLEERLKLMENESLPAVRIALFGPSPNRRFFD